MRVIALAAKKLADDEEMTDISVVENGMIFLGLVGIMDPPRPEVKEAIRICQDAGIKVKMITGDHHMTASAIGQELSINGAEADPVSGLIYAVCPRMNSQIPSKKQFFTCHSDQKMRIVSSLQEQGEIVAMTGDGVNDAPALSGANIGIAMGIAGTDVAKDARIWSFKTIILPTLFTLSRKDEKSTKIFEISYVIKFQPTLLLWHLLLSRRSSLVGNFHSLRRKSLSSTSSWMGHQPSHLVSKSGMVKSWNAHAPS